MSEGINFTNSGGNNTNNNNSGNISNNNGSNNNYNGGNGNTFHLGKSEEKYEAKPIKFENKLGSCTRYRRKKINKIVKRSLLISISAFLMFILGLISNLITFLSFLGLPPSLIWFVFCAIVIWFHYSRWDYYRMFVLGSSQSRNYQDGIYFGNGRILRIDEFGNCITYEKIADCTYYDCQDKVYLVDAPPRERKSLQNKFVGVCSKSGKDHTYAVDSNWIGHPRLFDWLPIDKKTNNK